MPCLVFRTGFFCGCSHRGVNKKVRVFACCAMFCASLRVMMKPILFVVCVLCSVLQMHAAENRIAVVQTFSADSDSVYVQVALPADTAAQPGIHQAPTRENVKLVAAILAFPFPFGMIGLHRIYLGTKPWVPIVYLCTLGGCFGVLPFIDFVVILLQDEEGLKQYQNNDKVFMWVK